MKVDSMCGIFASIPLKDDWIINSVNYLYERGPDNQSFYRNENVGFAITRLAITDVNSGFQPIESRSGNTLCIFNGAIYNTQELINNFSINPKTSNDGAVVIELYEKFGLIFGTLLAGMFSVIIFDKRDRKVIVARDPIGIKPLYWVKNKEYIAFGSWPQAFPKELLPKVKAFKPGYVWTNRGDFLNWSIPILKQKDFESILRKTVNNHTPKEVRWGVMLSGGVDSSLLCAILKQNHSNFSVYTLYIDGSDDSKAAEKVCEELKLTLKYVSVTEKDIINAIPLIIEKLATFEKDLVINGIGTFFIASAAQKDGLKVLLSGEGADELFAGYSQYNNIPSERLNDVLISHQNDLCSTECKRVDAAGMAASIEIRVPYLSNEIISYSRVTDANKKIKKKQEVLINKLQIRAMAAKLLNKEIAYREKEPFLIGSGLDLLVAKHVESIQKKIYVTDDERLRYELTSKTEEYFYTIWKKKYGTMSSSLYDMKKRGLARREGQDLPPSATII